MRNMQALTEQMIMLVRTHQPVPTYYESGPHTLGLWCTNGCANPAGHTSQFCKMLLQPPPTGVPQPQYQQSQSPYQQPPRQQLVQAQLYQPPQRTGPEKSTTQQNPRPQQATCSTCGNLHAPGRCWVENNIMCGNCDGHIQPIDAKDPIE
jgi:hypothetical protein